MSEYGAFSGAVTDTATSTQGVSSIGQLGALRFEPDGRVYRCVKATNLQVVGQFCAYSGNPSPWLVTSTTADEGLVAGLNVAAIPASGFGWILVSGEGEAKPGAAITAGKPVSIDSTDGMLEDATGSAAEAAMAVGVAIDEATGDVTPALITVWVRGLI